MKANELRIGNFVLFAEEGTEFKVNEISEEGLWVINDEEKTWIELDCFEPIPLTEEWLLKFGFEKVDNNWQKEWLLLHVNLKTGTIDFLLNEPYSGKMRVTILESVHQLQNLIYALTGEELTIKEEETK